MPVQQITTCRSARIDEGPIARVRGTLLGVERESPFASCPPAVPDTLVRSASLPIRSSPRRLAGRGTRAGRARPLPSKSGASISSPSFFSVFHVCSLASRKLFSTPLFPTQAFLSAVLSTSRQHVTCASSRGPFGHWRSRWPASAPLSMLPAFWKSTRSSRATRHMRRRPTCPSSLASGMPSLRSNSTPT